ncbi:MAG: hypothetical protein QHG94_08090, partial [Candidatus Methanosuratincola sp.]|nr:hypothetical protein [Candidatus Methanosuratincola sp.]
MRLFNTATDDEIKSGLTSDIYYLRTRSIIEAKGVDKEVVAEVSVGSLPEGWKWGVFCGLDEVINLYTGLTVDVYSLPEGTIFPSRDIRGYRI